MIQLSKQLAHPSPEEATLLLRWLDGDGLKDLREVLEIELDALSRSLPLDLITRKLLHLYGSLHVIRDITRTAVEMGTPESIEVATLAATWPATGNAAITGLSNLVALLPVIEAWSISENTVWKALLPNTGINARKTAQITAESGGQPQQIAEETADVVTTTVLGQDHHIESKFAGVPLTMTQPYDIYSGLRYPLTFILRQVSDLRQAVFKVLNYYFYSMLDILLLLPNTQQREHLLASFWQLINELGLTVLQNHLQYVTVREDLPDRGAMIQWILAR